MQCGYFILSIFFLWLLYLWKNFRLLVLYFRNINYIYVRSLLDYPHTDYIFSPSSFFLPLHSQWLIEAFPLYQNFVLASHISVFAILTYLWVLHSAFILTFLNSAVSLLFLLCALWVPLENVCIIFFNNVIQWHRLVFFSLAYIIHQIKSFICHFYTVSFIQHWFIEHLLCVRHYSWS